MACKSCGGEILEKDIDSRTSIGTCRKCFTIASFKGDMPVPKGMKIERKENDFTIIRPFRVDLFLIFMAAFWNFCTILGSLICLSYFGLSLLKGQSLIALLYLGGFLLLLLASLPGIYMIYCIIRSFVNKTFIEMKGNRLSIRHGPMPGYRNSEFCLGDFEKIYAILIDTDTSLLSYEIHGRLKDGNIVGILSGLARPEEALFIEQEIDKYWKKRE